MISTKLADSTIEAINKFTPFSFYIVDGIYKGSVKELLLTLQSASWASGGRNMDAICAAMDDVIKSQSGMDSLELSEDIVQEIFAKAFEGLCCYAKAYKIIREAVKWINVGRNSK
jgi:hypothetical protein